MAKRKVVNQAPVETFTENCCNSSCPGFQVPVGTWGDDLNKYLVAIYHEGYDYPVCEVCEDTLLSSGDYFRTPEEDESYRHRYDEPNTDPDTMTFDESWRLIHDLGIGNADAISTDGYGLTLYEFLDNNGRVHRFWADDSFDNIEYVKVEVDVAGRNPDTD